jgi:hypothetical protein
MREGGQRYAPAALRPRKTRYQLYAKLGGPQDRSGQVRKTSLPPEFDPRTVQPVASRYTDWAIPAQTGQDPERTDSGLTQALSRHKPSRTEDNHENSQASRYPFRF